MLESLLHKCLILVHMEIFTYINTVNINTDIDFKIFLQNVCFLMRYKPYLNEFKVRFPFRQTNLRVIKCNLC